MKTHSLLASILTPVLSIFVSVFVSVSGLAANSDAFQFQGPDIASLGSAVVSLPEGVQIVFAGRYYPVAYIASAVQSVRQDPAFEIGVREQCGTFQGKARAACEHQYLQIEVGNRLLAAQDGTRATGTSQQINISPRTKSVVTPEGAIVIRGKDMSPMQLMNVVSAIRADQALMTSFREKCATSKEGVAVCVEAEVQREIARRVTAVK